MNLYLIITAFTGGVLSFLSPCILPLVPGYISTVMSGFKGKRTSKCISTAGILMFCAGFSLVFILMGATAASVGRLLNDHRVILTSITGTITVLLGLHMTEAIRIPFLYSYLKLRIPVSIDSKLKLTGAFAVGCAFASGWTPCAGPVLGGILMTASEQEHPLRGAVLLGFYSMGLCLPFILSSIFMPRFTALLDKYPSIPRKASKLAGILLIISGILILSGRLSYINRLL